MDIFRKSLVKEVVNFQIIRGLMMNVKCKKAL